MAGYRYKIQVEPLADKHGNVLNQAPLCFEVENHDDILTIVELLQSREDLNFGQAQTAAFGVGLKLFSEVMLKNKDHPVFAPLKESFKEFMTVLKRSKINQK